MAVMASPIPGVRGHSVVSTVMLQDHQRDERLSTAEPLVWSLWRRVRLLPHAELLEDTIEP